MQLIRGLDGGVDGLRLKKRGAVDTDGHRWGMTTADGVVTEGAAVEEEGLRDDGGERHSMNDCNKRQRWRWLTVPPCASALIKRERGTRTERT